MGVAGATVVVGLADRQTAAGFSDVGLVGREETLVDLAASLAGPGSVELALTAGEAAVTLHGLGGIGKTALALEYCHQHSGEYSLVWWVNADSEQTLLDSYRELLGTFSVEVDDQHLKAGVSHVLGTAGRWLAVFDNVDDREFFDHWRPPAAGGQVLITTRSNDGWANKFPVGLLPETAARQWLLTAAGDPKSADERSAADELVERLDGLALALTMATAYISRGVPLTKYLDIFDTDAAAVMNDQHRTGHDYDQTVYTALAVSRNRLRTEQADAAILLLEYASFFAPDNIPLAAFTPDSLEVASELDVINARIALEELSLITTNDSHTHFSMHRLIQAVTRYYLDHPNPNEQANPTTQTAPPPPAAGEDLQQEDTVVKIVMFTANSMVSALDLEREVREIKDVLEAAKLRDNITLELSPAATPDDLVKDVSNHEPKIVHFSGHGHTTGIALRDDTGGHTIVSGDRLNSFFEDRGVDLVVLNSCYSEHQATEIAKAVPIVIGTPQAVTDDAAIRFSKAFYRTLGNGKTVARAYKDGQDAVNLHNLDDQFVTHGDLSRPIIGS